MSLQCGIVGLPNVGKSTLFNALTKAGIAAENYPFCTNIITNPPTLASKASQNSVVFTPGFILPSQWMLHQMPVEQHQ